MTENHREREIRGQLRNPRHVVWGGQGIPHNGLSCAGHHHSPDVEVLHLGLHGPEAKA
jgi:hypothetical protein